MHEADKRYLDQLLQKKKKREEQVNSILDESDKRAICKVKGERVKRYNLTQAAKILEVPRQTIYYWIRKKWVTPRYDYRNYPVFTPNDIKKIEKWRNTLK